MTFLFFLLFVSSCFSEENSQSIDDSLSSKISLDRFTEEWNDSYIEGYVQALLDLHYRDYFLRVQVERQTLYLYNLPIEQKVQESIFSFIEAIPCTTGISILREKEKQMTTAILPSSPLCKESETIRGNWFPQSDILFPPFLADPRKIHYSVGFRTGDQALGNQLITVSGGEQFSIFRWKHLRSLLHADAELRIEAGVYSLFNPLSTNSKWAELVNTDFYVGFPLVLSFEQWSFRLRLYHTSSHLGDEYISSHPETERLNPSMEALEWTAAHQWARTLRLYGGIGWIFHSDASFPEKPLYLHYGLEYRFGGYRSDYHRLYTQPFFAIHCRQSARNHWTPDCTLVLGLEWSKLSHLDKKFRIYLEFHKGHSLEGQFAKKKSSYASLNCSYGF